MSTAKIAQDDQSKSAVLDASAAIATLHNEAGAEEVDSVASSAVILTVNLCEVVTKLVRDGIPYSDARAAVQSLGIHTIPFDDELAYLAASLEPKTRHAGLSLGDRACLALGISRKLPIVTADRTWKDLNLPVKVRLIR